MHELKREDFRHRLAKARNFPGIGRALARVRISQR